MFRKGRACAPNSERASFIGLSSNSSWISFDTKIACFMSSSLLLRPLSALTNSAAVAGGMASAVRKASKRVSSGESDT